MNPTESREPLQAFIDSAVPRNTLGLLQGRRRVGKSTLLVSLVEARQGFYWEATRGEPAVQLARLGKALGAHLARIIPAFPPFPRPATRPPRPGSRGAGRR